MPVPTVFINEFKKVAYDYIKNDTDGMIAKALEVDNDGLLSRIFNNLKISETASKDAYASIDSVRKRQEAFPEEKLEDENAKTLSLGYNKSVQNHQSDFALAIAPVFLNDTQTDLNRETKEALGPQYGALVEKFGLPRVLNKMVESGLYAHASAVTGQLSNELKTNPEQFNNININVLVPMSDATEKIGKDTLKNLLSNAKTHLATIDGVTQSAMDLIQKLKKSGSGPNAKKAIDRLQGQCLELEAISDKLKLNLNPSQIQAASLELKHVQERIKLIETIHEDILNIKGNLKDMQGKLGGAQSYGTMHTHQEHLVKLESLLEKASQPKLSQQELCSATLEIKKMRDERFNSQKELNKTVGLEQDVNTVHKIAIKAHEALGNHEMKDPNIQKLIDEIETQREKLGGLVNLLEKQTLSADDRMSVSHVLKNSADVLHKAAEEILSKTNVKQHGKVVLEMTSLKNQLRSMKEDLKKTDEVKQNSQENKDENTPQSRTP